MELSQQVASLELAKKLKELDVKQESLFYWRLRYSTSESFHNGFSTGKKGEFGDYRIEFLPKPRYRTADVKWNEADLSKLDNTEISAFTVAELGEMLPREIGDIKLAIIKGHGTKIWIVSYVGLYLFPADNLADAMAGTLVYLLENKLINNG